MKFYITDWINTGYNSLIVTDKNGTPKRLYKSVCNGFSVPFDSEIFYQGNEIKHCSDIDYMNTNDLEPVLQLNWHQVKICIDANNYEGAAKLKLDKIKQDLRNQLLIKGVN